MRLQMLPMKEFHFADFLENCRLVGVDIHTATHLTLPISKEDVKALVLAAFKSGDDKPRSELQGVFADKAANGVRAR